MANTITFLRRAYYGAALAAGFGILPLNSGFADATTSSYKVRGLYLGENVTQNKIYQTLKCTPSTSFDDETMCSITENKISARGRYAEVLQLFHASDGTLQYIGQNIAPAWFEPNAKSAEIERISKIIGEKPKTFSIPLPEMTGGRPAANFVSPEITDTVIAIWGGAKLKPLEQTKVDDILAGRKPNAGSLIDYLGDIIQSAKLGLPIYTISGTSGLIWAAAYDASGKGVLRIIAVDNSKLRLINGQQIGTDSKISSRNSTQKMESEPELKVPEEQKPAAKFNSNPPVIAPNISSSQNSKATVQRIPPLNAVEARGECIVVAGQFINSDPKYMLSIFLGPNNKPFLGMNEHVIIPILGIDKLISDFTIDDFKSVEEYLLQCHPDMTNKPTPNVIHSSIENVSNQVASTLQRFKIEDEKYSKYLEASQRLDEIAKKGVLSQVDLDELSEIAKEHPELQKNIERIRRADEARLEEQRKKEQQQKDGQAVFQHLESVAPSCKIAFDDNNQIYIKGLDEKIQRAVILEQAGELDRACTMLSDILSHTELIRQNAVDCSDALEHTGTPGDEKLSTVMLQLATAINGSMKGLRNALSQECRR